MAQRHEINANTLFKWRREFRADLLDNSTPALLLVQLENSAASTPRQHASIPGETRPEEHVTVIGLPAGTRIWLAAGVTDMLAGFNGPSAKAQTALAEDPFNGHVFVFRGRRGDIIKLLWWTGDGLCLLAKRLERGRFI